MSSSKGPEKIRIDEHLDLGSAKGAKKVTDSVLVPGTVITADISAAGVLVGKGNLIRIRISAATFVAFGSSPSMAAVTSSTSPGLELNTAGTYMINATDDFIRASANPARVEVIKA